MCKENPSRSPLEVLAHVWFSYNDAVFVYKLFGMITMHVYL